MTSLINLLVEIEDKKTIKHEAYLKIGFGGITVLSLISIGNNLPLICYVVNVCILIALSLRLHTRLKAF